MEEDAPEFDADRWADQLRAKRREKDRFFAENPQSPVPPETRAEFDGLDYFDPDPEFRVRAAVTTVDGEEPVEMEMANADPVRYLRAVRFAFDVDGEEQTLVGYRRATEDDGSLFVPFRDKTTGQQSYGGGRYMELQPSESLTDGAVVTIDFNLAYTPFCAYSDVFACPLPPEENWLGVAVTAGERTPPV